MAGGITLAFALAGRRRPGRDLANPAALALDERLARGDIGEEEYAHRRAVLNATLPARPAGRGQANTALVIALAATVGLGAASVALAVTTIASSPAGPAAAKGCTVPSLPGQVVGVRLWDMMGMTGGH